MSEAPINRPSFVARHSLVRAPHCASLVEISTAERKHVLRHLGWLLFNPRTLAPLPRLSPPLPNSPGRPPPVLWPHPATPRPRRRPCVCGRQRTQPASPAGGLERG